MNAQEAFPFEAATIATGVRLHDLSDPANTGRLPAEPDAVRTPVVVRLVLPDETVVGMWLDGKSPATIRAYARTLAELRAFLHGASFRAMQLHDLQAFVKTLRVSANSKCTAIAAIKSFFRYAHEEGGFPANVARRLRVIKARETLQDRIMGEDDVTALLKTASGRDALYLRFLYDTAFRVSESVSVCWSDFSPVDRGEAVVTVFGKGGKTRSVRLQAETWALLVAYRGSAPSSAFVWPFGAPYARKRVRLIRRRAQLEVAASPHWFRHAHASHYIAAGGQLDALQRRLGHESIETTSKYVHARPQENTARLLRLLHE